jgi:MFS family permease
LNTKGNGDAMKWIKTDGKIVIPGILMMLIMGSVYSYSVFRVAIEDQFDLSASQSGLPYMLSLFFYAFFMGVSGKVLEKIHAYKVFIIGVILIFLGWFIAFLSQDFLWLALGYGFFIGSGIGFIYGIPLMVITQEFKTKKGLYIGLVLLGFGLSPLISAPVLQTLINRFDLHLSFLIMGLFSLVSLFLLSLFYKNYTYKKTTIKLEKMIETLKKPAFIFLYLLFFIGTFIGLTVIGFTSGYAVSVLDYSLEQAAIFVSIFAIFNGLGRVIFGSLTDKFPIDRIMMFSFVSLLFASLMMIIASQSILVFIISFAIIWMNLGGWLAIAPATTSKIFDQNAYTRNYGILFSAYGVSAIVGVYASGYLTDLFGDYTYSFVLFAGLAFIGLILTTIFRKYL